MPTKSVAILQSNYIPWKGYFDIISAVDEFVLFDEVQYTRRDWRNRNRIIFNDVPHWLSIPLQNAGNYNATIADMQVVDGDWAQKHWQKIAQAYAKAPFFKSVGPELRDLYMRAADLRALSEINAHFLQGMMRIIGLSCTVTSSLDVERRAETATARLIEICLACEASEYVSGPAAKSYIDRVAFADAGLTLRYTQYEGYQSYPQFSDSFEHGVSMIDALLQLGPEAAQMLKSHTGREHLLEPFGAP